MPLPINIVPTKALGDKFAVEPIRLQIASVMRNAHRSVAEYLQENSRRRGMTLVARIGHAITPVLDPSPISY